MKIGTTATIVPFPRRPAGDPVVEHLKRRGLPVTREKYPIFAYPEEAPEPLPGELEALMREALDPPPRRRR